VANAGLMSRHARGGGHFTRYSADVTLTAPAHLPRLSLIILRMLMRNRLVSRSSSARAVATRPEGSNSSTASSRKHFVRTVCPDHFERAIFGEHRSPSATGARQKRQAALQQTEGLASG
jgi:hypothetical protein